MVLLHGKATQQAVVGPQWRLVVVVLHGRVTQQTVIELLWSSVRLVVQVGKG